MSATNMLPNISANQKWKMFIDYIKTNDVAMGLFMRHFVRNMNLSDEDVVNAILDRYHFGFDVRVDVKYDVESKDIYVIANSISDYRDDIITYIRNNILTNVLMKKFYDVKNNLFIDSIPYLLDKYTKTYKNITPDDIDKLYIKSIIGVISHLTIISNDIIDDDSDSDMSEQECVSEVEECEKDVDESDDGEKIIDSLSELINIFMGNLPKEPKKYVIDLKDIGNKLANDEDK